MTRLAQRHPASPAESLAASSAGESSRDGIAAEATRLLYERHRQRIFAFCLNRLGNRHEAEDALQTTFLYVFRSLQRGVVPRNEAPWLYTIAANACRARRRALWRRRRLEASVDPDTLHDVLDPVGGGGRDELAGMDAALASLPTNQRRALLLREWQGLSYREIATALSLSQPAVETLLFRARRTMARKLREAADHAAVALNAFPLVKLARRLAQAGTPTKAAATLVALSVAAGSGGRALQEKLRHPRVSPADPALGPAAPSAPSAAPRPAASEVATVRMSQSSHTDWVPATPAAPPVPAVAASEPVAAAASSTSPQAAATGAAAPAPSQPSPPRPDVAHQALDRLPPARVKLPSLPKLPAPPSLPAATHAADQLVGDASAKAADLPATPSLPNVHVPPIQVPPTEGTQSLPLHR